jgi:hypothetical protein
LGSGIFFKKIGQFLPKKSAKSVKFTKGKTHFSKKFPIFLAQKSTNWVE